MEQSEVMIIYAFTDVLLLLDLIHSPERHFTLDTMLVKFFSRIKYEMGRYEST
jgi:hypothetical protein